jgi:hypothetical protein
MTAFWIMLAAGGGQDAWLFGRLFSAALLAAQRTRQSTSPVSFSFLLACASEDVHQKMSSIRDELEKIPPVTRFLALSYVTVSVSSWVGLFPYQIFFSSLRALRGDFKWWTLYTTHFWSRPYPHRTHRARALTRVQPRASASSSSSPCSSPSVPACFAQHQN